MIGTVSARRLGCVLIASFACGALLLLATPRSFGASPTFSLAGEPVDLRADRVDVDLGSSTATLEGHVELTRTDLRIACPRAEARFDRDGRILRAKGAGGVVVVVGPKGIRGEASEIELDVVGRTAELRGNVRVSQGASTLTAARASVDLATSRVSLEGVRGTFAAAAAAPAATVSGPAASVPSASASAAPPP